MQTNNIIDISGQTQTQTNHVADQTVQWPDPARPGNHLLSIYMCGFIDISGGGIELHQ